MEGVLIIDKPEDFTSFDVVAKMRGILKTRKIGHTGTLDPMATGVLPLLLGRAAKACDILPDDRKRYTARFRLGITTDTQDITGTILQKRPVTASEPEILAAIAAMEGDILQIPPMYSAIQINGQRLYDLARQGIEVEREPRPATIEEIHLLNADPQSHEYEIDVLCSKGTYIRTLCHDIGEALGCGGTLTALRRTMAAGLTLADAITLEEAQALADAGTITNRVLPVESLFGALPSITLNTKRARLFSHGVRITLCDTAGQYAVFGPGGFLGVAITDREGVLQSRKLFTLEV